MILDNEGLVRMIAKRLAPLDRYEEAVSFGWEGLIFAVDRFDPLRGTKFSTYAYKCILGYIHEGLYCHSVHWKPDIPVDFSAEYGEIGGHPDPVDQRTPPVEEPVVRTEVWERIRKFIDPRRFEIIYAHFVGGKNFTEIGALYSLSRERVRQLFETGLQSVLNRVPNLVELLS